MNDGDDQLEIGGFVTQSIWTGAGDDKVKIVGNFEANLSLGDDNDYAILESSVRGNIDAGAGDDIIKIIGNSDADISLGMGNDKLEIGKDSFNRIGTGSGDDTVEIGNNLVGLLTLGEGNDSATIKGDVYQTVNAGAGDDIVVIDGLVNNYIVGSYGNDSIVLNAYDSSSFKYIADLITGFETIKLGDGSIFKDGVWTNEDELSSAILIDGIIEGICYETSSGVSGYTNENGSFNFKSGDDVSFSIGGVVLGLATAEDIVNGKIFLQDIADVNRSDLNDEYLENMAVFLQSIDTATSGDNIVITQEVRDSLANVNIDLRTASEDELQEVIQSIGGNYVDESSAMSHVQEMLEEYTDMESKDFDAHIDDISIASLGKESLSGIEYETSSGLKGITSENGSFEYHNNDIITFSKDGEVLSTIDSQNIREDNLLTLNDISEFNQNEIDIDNYELDFDNLESISNSNDTSTSNEDSNSLENLNLLDILDHEENDNSLSFLLGEEVDNNKEEINNEDNSNVEYCPFKTLEDNSSNLLENIRFEDTFESNNE